MIHEISASWERKRPQIDFTASVELYGVDWEILNDIKLRGRSVEDYREVHLVTESRKNASSWHFFTNPGTLGLISEEATRVIGPQALRLFHLLPVTVDGFPFAIPWPRESLDCFDRENSEFEVFPNSGRIMIMNKVAFKTDRIDDPLLFTIPEYRGGLYGTGSVKDAIVRAKLRGFRFETVFG